MIRELKRSDFANPLKKKLTHARESFLQEKKHQKAVVTKTSLASLKLVTSPWLHGRASSCSI